MKKTITAALLSTIALCGCSEQKLPSTFQATSKSTVGSETVYTARDTGTGCEIIITSDGIMPRNERAADGVTVKQRCVVTGDEQPATVVETMSAPSSGQPAFAPPPQAATREDVLRAVQGAVRDRQQAIPPASAPAIPPPRGAQRTQQAAPADDGGVESQLK